MTHMRLSPLTTTAILCSAFALAPSQASAEPDLIINVQDSTIRPGSCETASSLVSGRIAIKNKGEESAALRVTERFTRSMLAVYVPENIDMIAKKTEREKLDPFDQEGIEFEIGAGVQKKGRNFGNPVANQIDNGRSDDDDDTASDRDQNRAIQIALEELNFEPGGVDGILGRNSRAAIRRFQASIDARETGFLTAAQRRELFQKAGTTVTSTSGARGITQVTIYAVVDPYNLVPETNEANNIKAFTFEVDCGE